MAVAVILTPPGDHATNRLSSMPTLWLRSGKVAIIIVYYISASYFQNGELAGATSPGMT